MISTRISKGRNKKQINTKNFGDEVEIFEELLKIKTTPGTSQPQSNSTIEETFVTTNL